MKKTVIILGTARTGTSMISGITHILGVDMMPIINPSVFCPNGAYENGEFSQIINKILSGECKDIDIKNLVDSVSKDRDMWGWKIPSTLNCVDRFLPFISNPYFIFVFRNPYHTMISKKHIRSQRHYTLPSDYVLLLNLPRKPRPLAAGMNWHKLLKNV